MEAEKPGYTTTEFWVATATVVISFALGLIALFVHTPLDHVRNSLAGLIPAFATIAAAIASAWYSHSRGKVKAAAVTPVVNNYPSSVNYSAGGYVPPVVSGGTTAEGQASGKVF